MAEKSKTVSGEGEKQLLTRAEILSGLLVIREKASKGEVKLSEVIGASYGAAKELLEIGDEQGAFDMLTSTTRLEAAYLERSNVDDMREVATSLRGTSDGFEESVNTFVKSSSGFVEGVDLLQIVGGKVSSAAESMERSATGMSNAGATMEDAGGRMDRASGVIHEASMRMGGH